jgi:DNA-binding GntR family transcriptional regulator
LQLSAALGTTTVYQQVEEQMRDNIRSGHWPAHYKLKPEPHLAEELGLARGTLRQAIRALVDEGMLVPVRRKGTFVTAGATDVPLAQRVVPMHESFAATGLEVRTEVLRHEVGLGPERVRSLLDVDEGDLLLHLGWRMVVRDTHTGCGETFNPWRFG